MPLLTVFAGIGVGVNMAVLNEESHLDKKTPDDEDDFQNPEMEDSEDEEAVEEVGK